MNNQILIFILFSSLSACTVYTSGASGSSVFDEKSYEVYLDGEFNKVKLDKAPTPVEGDLEFVETLYQKLTYPFDAQVSGVQGTVNVSVVLDELGEFQSAEIKEGLGYGCDEEALAAIQRAFSKINFEPAIFKKKPAKVRFTVYVQFKMS